MSRAHRKLTRTWRKPQVIVISNTPGVAVLGLGIADLWRMQIEAKRLGVGR